MGRLLRGLVLCALLAGVGIGQEVDDHGLKAPDKKDGPPKPEVRIHFYYESVRTHTWRRTSNGKLFHYGKEIETKRTQGTILLEAPDQNYLTPMEVRDDKNKLLQTLPRLTSWGIAFPGTNKWPDGTPRLDVGGNVNIKNCSGTTEYAHNTDSNNYALAEHSRARFRWYNTTREARASVPLKTIDDHMIWSLKFYDNVLNEFHFHPPGIDYIEERNDDGVKSTSKHYETVDLAIPAKGKEGDWSISRYASATHLGAAGSRAKEKHSQDDHGWDHDKTVERVSFTLDIDPATYVLAITPPAAYKSWLPRGGRSESEVGSKLKLTGEFKCIEGKPAAERQFELRAYLDSSTQPGVCMNYPQSGAKTPDLKILRAGTSPELKLEYDDGTGEDDATSTATGTFKLNQKFTIEVGCYDYGAFGSLLFGADVPVQIAGYPDRRALDIPLDENHNQIADAWEHPHRPIGNGRVDGDWAPLGNGVDGDGLSAYEEYRGFMCRGVHTRTDPLCKDLFVYDPNNLGCGLLPQSGLIVHFVGKGEFKVEEGEENPHVINYNRDHATLGQQHLLYLRRMSLKGDDAGQAEFKKIGPPRQTKFVDVDVSKCRQSAVDVAGVIAHELAHGCNVHHHGLANYDGRDAQMLIAGKWEPMDDGKGLWVVAARGGPCSGVQECMMRYNNAAFYERADGPFQWRRTAGGPFIRGDLWPSAPMPRKLYCDTKEGTGVNDRNYPGGSAAGDAMFGDCLHQFQVNDYKPPKTP